MLGEDWGQRWSRSTERIRKLMETKAGYKVICSLLFLLGKRKILITVRLFCLFHKKVHRFLTYVL